MTKLKDLNDLHRVIQAKYRSQQQAFSKIVAEENRLRTEIMRLDQQARDAEDTRDMQQRAIGADVIWKAWVGRTKTQLNLQLAQILAQKEHHVRQVRKAYGKVLVSNELLDEARRSIKHKMEQDMLSKAIDQSLFN